MDWLLGVWKRVTSDYGGTEILCCGQLEHTEKVTLGKGKEYTFVHCLPRSCWYLLIRWLHLPCCQRTQLWKLLSLLRQAAGGISGQHGHPHSRNPSDLPFRAKDQGCYVSSTSALLLFKEKGVLDQYLEKYICIYCVIYDRVKFHTVLQVFWNAFALACPLTALHWIMATSSGIYWRTSCSLSRSLPLGRRYGRMLPLSSLVLGYSGAQQAVREGGSKDFTPQCLHNWEIINIYF